MWAAQILVSRTPSPVAAICMPWCVLCASLWVLATRKLALSQVEVIVHMYIRDGSAARDVVTAMLRELSRSSHNRVIAVEMIVNASLRFQLLLGTAYTSGPDSCTSHATAEDELETVSDDEETFRYRHEHFLSAVVDLRRQLVRLVASACEEEHLDAAMSDAAVTALLLLCTHNGEYDQSVYQELPLETLAFLVTHTSSNATTRHGDGMAHAALVQVLFGALHCYAPHGCKHANKEAQEAEGEWKREGFEERLRRVGGVRWVLLQLRNARSSRCRQQLYSVVMRYVLVAVMEAHGEGGSSSEEDADEEPLSAGGQVAVGSMWERACVEVVQQLDDYALSHALAQALWARSPKFSDLLAVHVTGPTMHHAAAAHELFAALEQLVSLHEDDCSHMNSPTCPQLLRRARRSWLDGSELKGAFLGDETGAGAEVDVEDMTMLLRADSCIERSAGVRVLFTLHERASTLCAGISSVGGDLEGSLPCAECVARAQSICLDVRRRGESDSDSDEDAVENELGGFGGAGCAALLEQGTALTGWVGPCVLDLEYKVLQRDARTCLGLLELTRKLLVHYKMSWARCPAATRASLALRIQLLISHRLEAIVSLMGASGADAMTGKCLTTMVDIILSLLSVGIPERAPQCRQAAAYEPDGDGDGPEAGVDGVKKGKCACVVKEEANGAHGESIRRLEQRRMVAGDRLEDLVLDGTLALHLDALRVAPWSVIYYVSFSDTKPDTACSAFKRVVFPPAAQAFRARAPLRLSCFASLLSPGLNARTHAHAITRITGIGKTPGISSKCARGALTSARRSLSPCAGALLTDSLQRLSVMCLYHRRVMCAYRRRVVRV